MIKSYSPELIVHPYLPDSNDYPEEVRWCLQQPPLPLPLMQADGSSRAGLCGCSLQHALRLLHMVVPCTSVGVPGTASLPCGAASTRCLGSCVFLRGVEGH